MVLTCLFALNQPLCDRRTAKIGSKIALLALCDAEIMPDREPLGAFPLRRDSDLPGARRRSGRGKGRAGVRSAKMVAIVERQAMPAWADRPRRGFGTARIFYKGLQI
ncbi:hypothetical protein Sj15T_34530 [Sphingobium sp. TA15]|uniref:Uncharacterized protein n=1 Tax=Sphingobium indicum (strain DSM 16413 / CCM 7287 / MTCC 6362 / UT26 / NBRC 101211 / UT26S) TaxID=452662 RepID=D4Z7A4_SPHIU|nr:hypothetical protein SJA_C2-00100 [Sphingobium indicum UT26S]BDD68432.1 hypothetical protein Sj15T_34530 [Sphingobium sp. TA15]